MSKIPYKTHLKNRRIHKVIKQIDPPIRDFIRKINKIDGIYTRYCCAGHDEYYAYIIFDRTPELKKLFPIFRNNRFHIKEYYDHVKIERKPIVLEVCRNNTLIVEDDFSIVDWQKLLQKLKNEEEREEKDG